MVEYYVSCSHRDWIDGFWRNNISYHHTPKALFLKMKKSRNELQAENDKLREVLEIVRKYAIIEYGESASCRIIASEIQQAFPIESHSEQKVTPLKGHFPEDGTPR